MRRLVATAFVSVVATALLVPAGHTAPRELWPGVTYENDVQFTPHGPVAILGSHGICFAAMVQLAADGLLESFGTTAPPERLGDCWLRVKHGVAKGKIDDLSYRLLDAVDGDSTIPQATQRLEHLEMFLLLGDPALRLPQVSAPAQER